MAKKNLIWTVELGFLTGRTPKTHKRVYEYSLFAEFGPVKAIDKAIDNHRQISSSFKHDDPVYDWFWYAMEDIGLAKVATRTAQLMQLLQDWLIEARKAGYVAISVE